LAWMNGARTAKPSQMQPGCCQESCPGASPTLAQVLARNPCQEAARRQPGGSQGAGPTLGQVLASNPCQQWHQRPC